jgi:parvulin-like peptidyl-prolyl isomerase
VHLVRDTGGDDLASRVNRSRGGGASAADRRCLEAFGRLRVLAAAVSTVAVVALAAAPVRAVEPDPPAATVNGRIIEGWEIDRELAVRISTGSYHRRVSDERLAELRCESLRAVVLKELKTQWARGRDVVVDSEAEEEAWSEMRARFSSADQFQTALELKGMSEGALRRAFHRDAVALAVDQRVVSEVGPPTDTQVEVWFLLHEDDYMTPEARRVVHVLVYVPPSADREAWTAAEDRAEDIVRLARVGEAPLMEVASAEIESLPPKFRDQIGDIGFVHQGSLAPAIDEAVFEAEVGSVTGPVATIYGYHVLHVLDQRKPQPLELADVREAVEGRVLRELSQRRLDGFEAELLAGAAVEIGMSECSGTL